MRAVGDLEASETVAALLRAFEKAPGVRRLASNPLLLTAVLLVHRSHGRLPQRRVDAYKAVTEALGRTWRAVQGVPEAELLDERRLTAWLTRLADWLHSCRPGGSASPRDLLAVLGPLWARMRNETWEPETIDQADVMESDVARDVIRFVEQVGEDSGLLIERAPRRWGFPHLAYEEFYTGRALAFDGRASERAGRFRRHLHDPLYAEPVLLGLALIGRDQPEEIEMLFEAALLARGEEAERLGLRPTACEEILGRDYLFALRALGDDIPCTGAVLDELLGRALDEWVDGDGSGQYRAYRTALRDRLSGLAGTAAGRRASTLIGRRMAATSPDDTARWQDLIAVTGFVGPDPAAVAALTDRVLSSPDPRLAIQAARVLADSGELSEQVAERLVASPDGNGVSRGEGVSVLVSARRLTPEVVVRLEAVAASDDHEAAFAAAHVLAAASQIPPAIVDRLVELSLNDNPTLAARALYTLRDAGHVPDATLVRLSALSASDDVEVALVAGQVLARHGQRPAGLTHRLDDLFRSDHRLTTFQLALDLSQTIAVSEEVLRVLLQMTPAGDLVVGGVVAGHARS